MIRSRDLTPLPKVRKGNPVASRLEGLGSAARRWLCPVAGCCWLASCAAGQVEPHVVEPPGPSAALGAAWRPPPGSCPMAVEGTSVLLVPIDGGAALVFTSSQSSPEVLRRAVLRFARQYQSRGRGQSGALRPAHGSPAGIPTYSRYAEILAGARVEIRPQYGAQLAELQSHLRRLASNMRAHGRCHAPAASTS